MPEEQIDNEVILLALLELATSQNPAEGGTLPPDVQQAMKRVAALAKGGGAKLSLEDEQVEYFGTEPPGDGWTSAGSMRWVRSLPPALPLPALPEPTGPRVAVVGGGPGGLFAAYILNQRLPEAQVTIFEASSRLGGKIETAEFPDGTQYEAGVAELYEYLGPGGSDPLRLLVEKDLKLPTRNISGGAVVLCDTIYRDLKEVQKELGYATKKRIERFHARMVELMPLEKYANRWQPDLDHPWASKTFHDCIYEEIPDDEMARCYIETAVHSDLATEPHTCNGLNGIKNVLMDNEAYMQLYHVVGGIGRLPDALAERLRATVNLRTRVTDISRGDGDGYLVDYRETTDEDILLGSQAFDAVLVAMPNHWLPQIAWGSPELHEAIHCTCEHYDLPAHYLRVTLLFKTPFWKKHDIPGEFWMWDGWNGCCVYDESTRWNAKKGHVLSFLLAGGDALLLCSSDQTDEEIVCCLLESLPPFMREEAQSEFLDGRVNRFAGSLNAQPGSWEPKELRSQHVPEPKEHPGIFLVSDFLFDSTLNGVLMSANTSVELLLDHLGKKSAEVTKAVEQLEAGAIL